MRTTDARIFRQIYLITGFVFAVRHSVSTTPRASAGLKEVRPSEDLIVRVD